MSPIKKSEPAPEYPPEEGCYLRGNDYSPVAVESGAALAGTLQTENIGLEKVICNVVSNPNIRYVIVCGPESPGHLTGQAVLALSACYQEEPTAFGTCTLWDPGAYDRPPLSGKITWRVTQPDREPKSDEERLDAGRLRSRMDEVRRAVEDRETKQ